MINKINDGGPAFSSEEFFDSSTGKIAPGGQGMSIRDYFAAKAMQGMLGGTWPDKADSAETARRAYALADDMLKAREK